MRFSKEVLFFSLFFFLILVFSSPPQVTNAGTLEGTVVLGKMIPQKKHRNYTASSSFKGNINKEVKPDIQDAFIFFKGKIGKLPEPEQKSMGIKSMGKVNQKDTLFVRLNTAITAGSTVDFPNLDPFFHNVFSYSKAKRFDLGRYNTNESRSIVIDKPGIIKLFCEIHSHMSGFLLVLENKYFSRIDKNGKALITDIPAGKYKVIAWHPYFKPQIKEINISEQGSVQVNLKLGK